jgi:hypothetical protein
MVRIRYNIPAVDYDPVVRVKTGILPAGCFCNEKRIPAFKTVGRADDRTIKDINHNFSHIKHSP